ncbi:hypothetical protein ACWOE5_06400 [Aerococcus sanguinicola]|uniref:PepSY domain-containing protein n=1 Tax=Aerococcus sanguinicola TaxID=119206 RepID=A0A0X8FAH4_9LACT|nr:MULTISPECIES: hypothetical protein [Aerococcus]AMB93785.1 hypothetical protein AWM72_02960 [Aerococcus sanguinicola]MDK7050363.1 hypothetical protein [Aerococcus sanguinicola]OFT94833.1 hypothetical protein HMPREF3090_05180 [Aerococcus sp. HMSC23C02]PKZ21484.1 hypothetical protein CYJ28_06135 [Aerococcus sanguinicola]
MKKSVIASVGLAALLVALNAPSATASQSLVEMNPNEASQAFIKEIPAINQLTAAPHIVDIRTSVQDVAPVQARQKQETTAIQARRAPEEDLQPNKQSPAGQREAEPMEEQAPASQKSYLMGPSQDPETGRTQYDYRVDSPDGRVAHLDALYQVDEATGQVYQMDMLTGQWVLLGE